jgi:hypothetical protein
MPTIYDNRISRGLKVDDDDKCKIFCKGSVFRHFIIVQQHLAIKNTIFIEKVSLLKKNN